MKMTPWMKIKIAFNLIFKRPFKEPSCWLGSDTKPLRLENWTPVDQPSMENIFVSPEVTKPQNLGRGQTGGGLVIIDTPSTFIVDCINDLDDEAYKILDQKRVEKFGD